MNHSDDSAERELRALFDATAAEPSQDTLDRLARFAAQVPARRRKRARWLWPALGLSLAAAASLALFFRTGDERPLALESALVPVVSSEPPLEVDPPMLEEEDDDAIALSYEEDDLVDADPFAALDATPADTPLALLDLLAIPEEPEALALWSSAYASVQEGRLP